MDEVTGPQAQLSQDFTINLPKRSKMRSSDEVAREFLARRWRILNAAKERGIIDEKYLKYKCGEIS